jgi:hypothetical protein
VEAAHALFLVDFKIGTSILEEIYTARGSAYAVFG